MKSVDRGDTGKGQFQGKIAAKPHYLLFIELGKGPHNSHPPSGGAIQGRFQIIEKLHSCVAEWIRA
jgi:hypothetical protein